MDDGLAALTYISCDLSLYNVSLVNNQSISSPLQGVVQ